MAWQKIDDQFGISKKVIRIPRKRRHRCVGLWLLAGNYASRILSDGVIESHELNELDAVPADVLELIRVELWHGHGHDCDRCPPVIEGAIVIHDYLLYNPPKEKVLADRESERVRKMSQRDKQRTPGGTTTGVPLGQVAESGLPVPSRPDPVPLTDVTIDTQSSHLPSSDLSGTDPINPFTSARAKSAGIHNLAAVTKNLAAVVDGPVSAMGAVLLAEAITSKAKTHVRKVDAYIATACRDTPVEVQEAYFDLDIAGVA